MLNEDEVSEAKGMKIDRSSRVAVRKDSISSLNLVHRKGRCERIEKRPRERGRGTVRKARQRLVPELTQEAVGIRMEVTRHKEKEEEKGNKRITVKGNEASFSPFHLHREPILSLPSVHPLLSSLLPDNALRMDSGTVRRIMFTLLILYPRIPD